MQVMKIDFKTSFFIVIKNSYIGDLSNERKNKKSIVTSN